MSGSVRKLAIELKQRFITNDSCRFQALGNIVKIYRPNRLLTARSIFVVNQNLFLCKGIFLQCYGRLDWILVQCEDIRSRKPADARQYDTDAENESKIDDASQATGLTVPTLTNRRFVTIQRRNWPSGG